MINNSSWDTTDLLKKSLSNGYLVSTVMVAGMVAELLYKSWKLKALEKCNILVFNDSAL